MVASLVTVAACGDGDDDGDTNITFAPGPEQQREEGPVSTSPSVVVNNQINNRVKIINKNYQVQNNNLIIKYKVVNADPVIHQQNVYVSVNCNQIINADINNDQIVDQAEVEQTVGAPVATLTETEGTEYEQTQSIPLDQLPADQEKFIFVVYGADEGVTVPVACNSFSVEQQNVNNAPPVQPAAPAQPDDVLIVDPALPQDMN